MYLKALLLLVPVISRLSTTIEPTLENTYSGEYPVWTFEHMYTKGEPNEVVSAFLDYITGDKYGSQMEKLGYGVSSKMTKTEH